MGIPMDVVARRYAAAVHGIQTAILFEMEKAGELQAGTTHKHLRVGVNSAMINDHAVATLLIAKGVFTQEEYDVQVMESAELELAQMTVRVHNSTGIHNVKFE